MEKIALEIAMKIEKWGKYYYLDLKEPVKYRGSLKMFVDNESILQLEYWKSYQGYLSGEFYYWLTECTLHTSAELAEVPQ